MEWLLIWIFPKVPLSVSMLDKFSLFVNVSGWDTMTVIWTSGLADILRKNWLFDRKSGQISLDSSMA